MAQWSAIPTSYDPLKAGSIDGTDDEPHDQAIWRAMHATYRPNKSVVGDPRNTVFVGRLSPNTDEEMLEKLFKSYGKLKRLRLVRDIVTGMSRCYGFVEFVDREDACSAAKHADKTVLDEKEIFVDFECERTLKGWIPRRLGGGISGRKESGQLRFGGKNRPFKRPFNVNTFQPPEGASFRERLQVSERDERDRQRSDRHRGRHRSRSRERSTSRRSRSRERRHYNNQHIRSRSKDRRK